MKNWSKFEQEVETTNKWYSRKGYGAVSKIPNGTKTIRVAGEPIIIPTDKTGCDFIGHFKGIPIAFDCKSMNGKSMPHKQGKNDFVKPHQIEFLKQFSNCGGVSGLMVRFNDTGDTFWVTIDKYIEMKNNALGVNKKSLPIAWFKGCKVKRTGKYLDYLENLEVQK
ncbi:Holliday junction resolvase RecU [Vagococcus vulneris]|uniref:Holliday junction resolvase RecU n=1 Tax=Vagococcus vulneris TaxID=1977869 RepID=A0A429ZTA2_9ENTE|nr:Holliday junction resolvase RecU [Vagococcus vulneris]RST96965.1 hypothetical protein CBF37_10435 [Vagococcus vulneris]